MDEDCCPPHRPKTKNQTKNKTTKTKKHTHIYNSRPRVRTFNDPVETAAYCATVFVKYQLIYTILDIRILRYKTQTHTYTRTNPHTVAFSMSSVGSLRAGDFYLPFFNYFRQNKQHIIPLKKKLQQERHTMQSQYNRGEENKILAKHTPAPRLKYVARNKRTLCAQGGTDPHAKRAHQLRRQEKARKTAVLYIYSGVPPRSRMGDSGPPQLLPVLPDVGA